ncbi:MAG: hypothetical protein QHC90_09360 [Shinella sp.]|nr:hypothetical protein [Shinella sp.]
MAHYQILTTSDANDISVMVNAALKKLDISLNRLASDAGVSQSMAHKAQHGRLKRRTPNVRRLELYIHIAMGQRDQHDVRSLDACLLRFLSAGGNIDTIVAIVDALSKSLDPVRYSDGLD